MKLLIRCIALIALISITALAQEARARIGEPVNKGTGQLFITPMPGQIPTSLKALCIASTLIVDGTVGAALPTRESPTGKLETDAIVIVSSTIKGPASVRKLAIAQRGGAVEGHTTIPAQYSLLQPGERCILFLHEDGRASMPDIVGAPRYLVSGIWSGLFQFDGARMAVKASTPDALRRQYEGLTPDQVISEVKKALLP